MKTYNGHRSRNAWNVALRVSGDEELYQFVRDCVRAHKSTNEIIDSFLLLLRKGELSPQQSAVGEKTPDGATYNRLSLKLAIDGLRE